MVKAIINWVIRFTFPVLTSLFAAFQLWFITLNAVSTQLAIDMFEVPLWAMCISITLGLILFSCGMWLAYKRKIPTLASNLALAFLLGTILLLEDTADAQGLMMGAFLWCIFTILVVALHLTANWLNRHEKALASSILVSSATVLLLILFMGALVSFM